MKKFIFALASAVLLPVASYADIPDGMCELVLEAHDVMGNGKTGFQWILDSSHSTYNQVFYFPGTAFYGSYGKFDYTIPEDAEANKDTDKVVLDGSVSITVPAGTYDWMVIRPDDTGLNYCYGDYAGVDDFPLVSGKTYRMKIEYADGPKGAGTYATFITEADLALTALRVPVSGVNLTDSEEIAVTITNNGTSDMGNFKVSYTINDGEPVVETVDRVLKAGEKLDYTFKTTANMSALGQYTIKATLEADGDMLAANNALESSCRKMESHALPYDYDFSQAGQDKFYEDWIIIDANKDNSGWDYNAYLANKNGDLGVACCGGCWSGDKIGNDWMISQPLVMAKGANHVSLSTRCINLERPEKMELCIGTAPTPESMTVIATFDVSTLEWYDKATTFNIDADGIYYVGVHTISTNGVNLSVGTVNVGAGEFVGKPLVSIDRLLVPLSNCDLPKDARIGVAISNKGTAALTDYTLACTVNGVTYETHYDNEVLPDTKAELYLDKTVDLSALGGYEILFKLTSADVELTQVTKIECVEPISELPVKTNFTADENTAIWQQMQKGGWNYDAYFQDFQAQIHGFEYGILSQGITLACPVRIKISYAGGGWGTTALGIYMGKAGSDVSTYQRIFFDDNVASDAEEVEFTTPIENTGNYSFIIADEGSSDSRSLIRLNEVIISEVRPHDIAISTVESPVSSYMPVSQIGGNYTYNVTIVNRGTEDMSGINVKALIDDKEYATSETAITVKSGETGTVAVTFALPEKKVGDQFTISFKAESDVADDYDADNTYSLSSVNVTESTRAYENITDPEFGTGANGSTLAVGNVYTFINDVDLTSITVGLSITEPETPNAKGDIAIRVYSLNDDLSLNRAIYSVTRKRGVGGIEKIDIPDMRLVAGSYYFEVEQLSAYNFGLGYDPYHVGVCYMRQDDELTRVENYSLCIRAEFEPGAVVYAADAQVSKFTSPEYLTGLYNPETTVSAIVRNSGYDKADFKVSLTMDNEVKGQTSVSLEPYEETEVAFEAIDLTQAGNHTLVCAAELENDENAANNSITIEIVSKEEADPYKMDFEECNDFDAAGQIFNPRWTTIDRVGLVTNSFMMYNHPHRQEPCGFIAFNPDATDPSMTDNNFPGIYAHSGKRFGLAYVFMPYQPGAENITECDTWIISPKLQLGSGSEFELYVKTRALETPMSELERYRILVSDTDDSPESFKIVGDDVRYAPVEDWGLATADLSEYDGKAVYVAVQYIGQPSVNSALMIDDLYVKTTLSVIERPETEIAVSVDGNNIIAPEGSRVFAVSGIEVGMTGLPSGIYIVKTPTRSVKVAVR